MRLTPFDWSVIVVGGWNRAIYTPAGVMHRLFDIAVEEEQPELNLQIPSDGLGPYKINHEGLVVIPDWRRFAVEMPNNDYRSLQSAMDICVKAIEDLPETPLYAAGVNVRHRLLDENGEDGAELDRLRKELGNAWDDRFREANREILEKRLVRVFEWRQGRVSLKVVDSTREPMTLSLHFERRGERPNLIDWLRIPASDIAEQVGFVYRDILGLKGKLQ